MQQAAVFYDVQGSFCALQSTGKWRWNAAGRGTRCGQTPNDYGKAVKCRGHIAYRERNGKPSWEEWQADTLAAELLMPTFLINAEIERVALTLPNGILYKSVSDPNYEKILEMAQRIGVSWSAIRIRLQQMQVIKGKPIHCHPLDIMRFGE